MKKTMRIVSLLLAVAMLVSCLAACSKDKDEEEATAELVDEIQALEYDEQSAALYDQVLGEFYEYYSEVSPNDDVNTRWAKMAIAEAKLMEAAVMFPTNSRGGNYAVSRVAPYTVSPCLYGNDEYRFQRAVVTTEFISAADRDALKAIYAEKKGTGEYEQAVKDYLTENGYEIKDSYSLVYNSDPKTWDALATSRQADTEPILKTYDGLYEYDGENVQQPALAESYEVSDDGLTYTFKIKQGLVWTDSQGRKVADVKADDFVAGMQHLMDAQGGLEWLIQPIIVGADDYISGNTTDFETVGVKAEDDATLVYTLNDPCPYFMTMLSYSIFAPMSRDYYLSQGGQFGEDYDAAAEDYLYGKDPDHIAYCGPYLVTGATPENSIVYEASPTYWNAENVNIKNLAYLYNDGSDATKAYNDAVAGVIDGTGLNSSSIELAKADGNFDTNVYISLTDATSYMGFMNINRAAYANVNDDTTVVSGLTDQEAIRTNFAMRNEHFRRAICFSMDRASYNAQVVGEDLKLNSLINSYTPGNFVVLNEDVTIDINGKSTSFAAGTNYGEIMQAQIDADGVEMTVWDPKADGGIGSSAGFDGWYNPEGAAAELETAIAELAEQGVVIDEEHPIHVELPYPSSIETRTNSANALKQSVDAALGGKVVVDLVDAVDADGWYYAGYYTDYGYEANYSFYDVSGWGPDYGDPSTYLDTFLPEYAGYMVKCLGIY